MAKKRPGYVVITGASSGIGEAFARHAAARGVSLGLSARREERLQALAADLRASHGVAVDVFCADLSLPGAGCALAKRVHDSGHAPAMLVNNAGFSIAQDFAATPYEAQRAFIELMITTPVALSHAFLPAMLQAGFGRIINISSLTALTCGGKGHTLYPGAKAFLLKFSQSLNAEVHERGVFVSAVLPGVVSTDFTKASGMGQRLKGKSPPFAQKPADVVKEAWRRNARGAEIIVPGMAPKLAAALFQYMPQWLMRIVARRMAEHYHVTQ